MCVYILSVLGPRVLIFAMTAVMLSAHKHCNQLLRAVRWHCQFKLYYLQS